MALDGGSAFCNLPLLTAFLAVSLARLNKTDIEEGLQNQTFLWALCLV